MILDINVMPFVKPTRPIAQINECTPSAEPIYLPVQLIWLCLSKAHEEGYFFGQVKNGFGKRVQGNSWVKWQNSPSYTHTIPAPQVTGGGAL